MGPGLHARQLLRGGPGHASDCGLGIKCGKPALVGAVIWKT